MRNAQVWSIVFSLAGSAATAAAAETGDESSLEREARLDVMVRLAQARNPELLESRERAAAAAANADAAGRLPDLELKGEVWGVPLDAPLSFGMSQMLMVGLRQAFPAPGSLQARARAAAETFGAVDDGRRARERDVTAAVKRAFVETWRAEGEYRVHLEHVGLLSRLVELSRVHYRSGQGSQQDLLRLTVELGELHTDVANLEQELRSGRAQLNTLMARPPDAPLGPAQEPPAVTAATTEAARAPAAAHATDERPEVAAAARAVRRSEALLDGARSSARWPSVMIGADYWNMPMFSSPHAYSAMLSITLPWLNPRHRDQVRVAERSLAADRRALEGQRNVARFVLQDARAKMDAARRAVSIIDADLLPQARRSFESAQAAYGAGQGNALVLIDTQRAYLQVRLQRSRAAARLAHATTDYEQAAATGRDGDAPVAGQRP